MSTSLPIDQHLTALECALADQTRLILVAQPGAGKTTRVPLRLLENDWAKGQRLLLLEPRRVAAKLAATFMADQLNERVGETVGYRMRGDSQIGPHTRLEVVTQGVLTRMLQEDPLLEGVAGIIFDEFHERSIEADLGLALALDVQESVRDDLRLLVMSATLDVTALTRVLGSETPVIESQGRAFPVETHYRPLATSESLTAAALRVIHEALSRPVSQDILVILPGVAEISQLVAAVDGSALDVEALPLHGRLPLDAQQAAMRPHGARQRVIVSTAIAESSVTIDGVNCVIDAGLERVPLFNSRTGLTKLTTRRVNKASADQRRGRAGRQQPGTCYRLWAAEQPLVGYAEPEILQADLSKLALELALWGVREPDELSWVTSPPEGAWRTAQDLLKRLYLRVPNGGLTPLGKQSAALALTPRLAAMLLGARTLQATPLACALAALLEGRERIQGSLRDALVQRLRQPSAFPQWHREATRLSRLMETKLPLEIDLEPLGALLCLAYPDRIAQRMSPGRFKLANGKTATLSENHSLAQQAWLVAVALESATSDARMYLAEPITLATLESLYPDTQQWEERIRWSEEQGKLVGDAVQRHGELILASRPLQQLSAEAMEQALLTALRQRPHLVMTDNVRQCQGRMALLSRIWPEQWPDWSETVLLDTLDIWLAPYVVGLTRLAQVEKLPFHTCLLNTLAWEQQQQMERLVPRALTAPSGNAISLDYAPCRIEAQSPILALKLQEAFGWQHTPTVVDGRVPITLHLLSPARRPLQVTQDLQSFWVNGYPEVRKEMRGRYPKNPWPEDPLSAQATALTKQRKG